MKKLLVAGTILLSASAFSTGVTAEFESRFNTLEQEYKMLMQKEDERYNSEKQIAETAKATLAKQRELYNQISTKSAKLGQIKDVKFYKEQYGELAKKYQDALREIRRTNERARKYNQQIPTITSCKRRKIISV